MGITVNPCKSLICCSYNPNRINISIQIKQIGKELDVCSKNYNNILLIGDFNADLEDRNIKPFCNKYKLKALNKKRRNFYVNHV